MKSLKAAAVVAGSLVAAGAAAPAFAYDPAPTSLNGGLNGAIETIGSQRSLDVEDLQPLKQQSNALDTENKDSALSTAKGATKALNTATSPSDLLLGGLPLNG
ncbi:hypothetical protein ACFYP4_06830 [Streptomyces sp. NPDC005551]|uniref:hypothetical protein n=1 Tax=unclassified Streptomyces TaxID=2593676 RepID=UPI0034083813